MNLYNPCTAFCNILCSVANCCLSNQKYEGGGIETQLDSSTIIVETKTRRNLLKPKNEIAIEDKLKKSFEFDEILRWYNRGKKKMNELLRIEVLHDKVVTLEL